MKNDNELAHYGIRGQKWGQRRFQNEDGSYTPEGRDRYRKTSGSSKKSGGATSAVKKVGKALDKLRKDSVMDGPKKQMSPRLPGTDFSKNRKKDPLEKMDEVFRVPTKRGPMRGMGSKTNGVYDRPDGTKDTNRLKKDAKKDAEDMARAKAYWGEGAGNRRKQIRNRISERMKDPDYKAEYEKQLASQDMSKHQKAANRERHAQDAKNTVAKTARGIKNLLLGVGSASLTAVALYNAAKLTGADKKIAELGKKAIADITRKVKSAKKPSVKDYNWHPNNGPSQNPNRQQRRDFVEKNDRAKHGRHQPYIDKDGNIHWY